MGQSNVLHGDKCTHDLAAHCSTCIASISSLRASAFMTSNGFVNALLVPTIFATNFLHSNDSKASVFRGQCACHDLIAATTTIQDYMSIHDMRSKLMELVCYVRKDADAAAECQKRYRTCVLLPHGMIQDWQC